MSVQQPVEGFCAFGQFGQISVFQGLGERVEQAPDLANAFGSPVPCCGSRPVGALLWTGSDGAFEIAVVDAGGEGLQEGGQFVRTTKNAPG